MSTGKGSHQPMSRLYLHNKVFYYGFYFCMAQHRANKVMQCLYMYKYYNNSEDDEDKDAEPCAILRIKIINCVQTGPQ